MKVLSPRVHGFIDFALVVAFLAAPTLFGFSSVPATLCYTLAGVHLVMTLLTDFPMGIIKAIPFTLHGALEFVVALALVAFPWLLDFAGDIAARNYFVIAGVGVFAVWLLTDYQSVETAADREARLGGTWQTPGLTGR